MPPPPGSNAAFDYADKNGDGIVDRHEFQALFHEGSPLAASGGISNSAAQITKKLLVEVREENDALVTI